MSNEIDLGKPFLTAKNVTIKDNAQWSVCLKVAKSKSFFLVEDKKKLETKIARECVLFD